uniref:Angio-associated migratory cell protein n=2 Tax=Parascaris univalens TaxID=6257 RepID=A0A915B3D9_PARUN
MDEENEENNGLPFRPEDVIKVIQLDDESEGREDFDDVLINGSIDHGSTDEDTMQESEEEGTLAEMADEASITISAHEKDVFCLDLFGDRWLASGGEDDRALLFDLTVNVNEPVQRICEHIDSVTCVRFNSSGSLLASGDMAGKIILTETMSLKKRCEVEDPAELEWLEWHRSVDILFAGASDGLLWMWLIGLEGVSQTKVFAGGAGIACTTGALLSDGKRLLAGYSDGSVRIWSLKDSTSISVNIHSPCICADVHNSSSLAVVGVEHGTCALISTDIVKVLRIFNGCGDVAMRKEDGEMDAEEGPSQSVECVRFCSVNEAWIAIGTNSGRLTIYDLNTGTARHTCEHDGRPVVACRFYRNIPDGTPLVLSACLDGVLRVWDARDGEPLVALGGGGDEIFDVFLSEESRKVVTACANGKLRIFELPMKKI